MYIEGFVKIGTRTKELVKYLSCEDIAVIQHDDIDELAAEALINTKLRAVINTGSSMTGRYLSKGTSMLVNNNIKLFDTNLKIHSFMDSEYIRIKDRDLILNNNKIYNNSCFLVNNEYIQKKVIESNDSYCSQLSSFIDNTLEFANKEKSYLMSFEQYPDLNTNIDGRCVIVVVRSSESHGALMNLHKFIENAKPLLIGVDGGADIIISCGYIPDILIGDMDSVSDVGIYRSKDVILHAYLDGRCPCLERIAPLNIKYKQLRMLGTSEDVALLMAYDKGASSIVLIGGHNCMIDFMERGRQGMGSTLLTRLKIEDRLIDYKHIKKYQRITNMQELHNEILTEGDLLCMKM